QRGIDKREYRAVSPDPERERDGGDKRERGCASQLAARESHIASNLFEPLCQAHFTISLSAQIDTLPPEPSNVAQAPERRLTGGVGGHSLLNQRTCAHLDMEIGFLVDFLLDGDAPDPRTKQAPTRSSFTHYPDELLARRSFDTPVENRRHR